MKISLISVSSSARIPSQRRVPVRRSTEDSKDNSGLSITDRLSIVSDYNDLVYKEAAALMSNKKDQAKSFNLARQKFVDELRSKGKVLPLRVGIVKRLNVDEVLKNSSNNPDYQKPSDLKKKETGELLIKNKFAKSVAESLTDENLKKLAKLDEEYQSRVLDRITDSVRSYKELASNGKNVQKRLTNLEKRKGELNALQKEKTSLEAKLAKLPENSQKREEISSKLLDLSYRERNLQDSISYERTRTLKAKRTVDSAKATLDKMKTPDGKREVLNKLTKHFTERMTALQRSHKTRDRRNTLLSLKHSS